MTFEKSNGLNFCVCHNLPCILSCNTHLCIYMCFCESYFAITCLVNLEGDLMVIYSDNGLIMSKCSQTLHFDRFCNLTRGTFANLVFSHMTAV